MIVRGHAEESHGSIVVEVLEDENCTGDYLHVEFVVRVEFELETQVGCLDAEAPEIKTHATDGTGVAEDRAVPV